MPSSVPIFLSILIFPGTGQLFQRRWIPALLFIVSSMVCTVFILMKYQALLQTSLSLLDPAVSEEQIMRAGSTILSSIPPLLLLIILYIWGIWDTVSAYKRARKQQSAKTASQNTPGSIVMVVLCSVIGTSTCFGDVEDMFDAIRSNDIARIDAVIEKEGWDAVKSCDSDGITPLHVAAAMNRLSAAALLISAGADINARTSAGFTPLHWAASKNAGETAKLLINSGANVNATATTGITPLHWAANKNATNIVMMLIAAGADVEARTENGFTPLHWATLNKSVESVRWLAFKIASDQVNGEIMQDAVGTPSKTSIQYAADDESRPPIATPREPPPGIDQSGKTLAVPIGLTDTILFVWVEPLKLWVGKYEVTNSQYRKFKSGHNSLFRETFKLNNPDQPAVYVSWDDAKAFCEWLNKNFSQSLPQGHEFRLPTEKEWLAIAGCGTNRKYPWGNEWPPKYGNYCDLTARKELADWSGIKGYDDGYPVSCPVTESGPNEWNIYGVAGNVWEWCDDWFDSGRKYKVRHGGSWDFDDEKSLRISYRGFDRPDTRDDTVGFRVVASPRK
jgi:hypothetical protein